MLLRIDRRMMATLSTHPQHVQTNGITFTNSGRELLLTTGEGTVKFVDYPSLVRVIYGPPPRTQQSTHRIHRTSYTR